MSAPIIGFVVELFAQRHEQRYSGFFPSRVHFATAGSDPIVRMRVTVVADAEAAATDYWAWWDAERDRVSFVWSHRGLVEMCFPYGSQAETDRGRGWIIRVRIEELNALPEQG